MMYVLMQTQSGPMLVPMQQQQQQFPCYLQPQVMPYFQQPMMQMPMMMPMAAPQMQLPPPPQRIPPQPQDEALLIKEMEWYLRDHCGGGSTSFINLQRIIREAVPCLVEKVIPAYENSWHRFITRCTSLVLFHYSHDDVARLNLTTWADEHEARIRLEETPQSVCEGHDATRAAEYASKLHELLDTCAEAVHEKGTVEVAVLSKIIAEKLPFFDGITKSSLKRVLSRTPNSALWVSGNFVKPRRMIDNMNVT